MAALAVAGVGDASLVVAGFAGLFPNATLVTLPGCGHFPWLEQPNQCNRDSWADAPGGISGCLSGEGSRARFAGSIRTLTHRRFWLALGKVPAPRFSAAHERHRHRAFGTAT
jgi:hypothetical protein